MRSGCASRARRRVPGVELDHVHLRRADQRLARVDLEHRRVVGSRARVELRACRGCAACRRASGRRAGRRQAGGRAHQRDRPPARCGSMCRATSRVVADEVELGDAARGVDHALGVGDATPSTTASPCLLAGGCRFFVAPPASSPSPSPPCVPSSSAVVRADGSATGCSRVIACGSLSLRSPWKTGWRMRPSRVHSANDTSATSFGCDPVALHAARLSRRTASSSVSSASSACVQRRRASSRRSRCRRCPHSAACPASSCTPSSSEPKPVREPLRIGEAADHELLALRALELDPVGLSAATRRARRRACR